MDFANYPFDIQNCTFKMSSAAFTADQLVFRSKYGFPGDQQRPSTYNVISLPIKNLIMYELQYILAYKSTRDQVEVNLLCPKSD